MPDTAEASVKVFISSVIAGMEEYRAAAREAAENLGYTVIAAEDFGASPSSPQQVCLEGVRKADVVVLLLGARYGTPQRSGLSPTHEEYHEARGRKPVLVFVQTGIPREPGEEKLVEEVSGWEGGQYREPFDSPASLRAVVTGALHRWALGQQAGPVNEQELTARAVALLPQRSTYAAGSPLLHVAVARVSRPVRDAGGRPGAGIPSLVEEDVCDRVAGAIRYAGWLLDRIDPTHRLSRVALACRLDGVGYLPWRTRAEVVASPNQARMGFPGREAADSRPVILPRAALIMDGTRQAEDITVRLRRQAAG